MEEAIANPVKGDFEAAHAAIDLRRILSERRAFEITMLNQIPVSGLQLLEAAFECFLLEIQVPDALRKLTCDEVFHLFAEHEAVARVFLAIIQHLVTGNAEDPGLEVRAQLEVVALLPDRRVGLLRHIIGGRITGEK